MPDLLQNDHGKIVPEGASAVYFEKEVYSMFANPEAEPLLDHLIEERNLKRTDVEAVVFGVATDYCIKAAGRGLARTRFWGSGGHRRYRGGQRRHGSGRARSPRFDELHPG